jgi:teichuronic acid biosynthesis glycosyltransferase TuaH
VNESSTVIGVPEHVPSAAKTDVVFAFSLETLDDAIGREFHRPPDQMVCALAGDPRVGELLIADPWRSYASGIKRRTGFRFTEPFTLAGRRIVRVRPRRLARHDSTDLATVEATYHRYGELLGRALARARGLSEPQPRSAALVTYHPFVAGFCDAPWIERVVYVGRDDWTSDHKIPQWRDVFLKAYQRIEERGADIFAVSKELAGRLSPRATVIPNGVIADVWRPRYPAPASIDSLPRPRAVYTGTMDRFERELVEISNRTVGSLVLIGPCDPSTLQWLKSLDRVHYFEPVGQQELAAMVQGCDIGLIPHFDREFTRAMSPLKLYEYLAAGLPVVSVDLPPIHGVDDERVLICAADDWASGLNRAVEMGHAPEDYRQRFIDEVSWERRLHTVIDAAVGSG